MKYRAGDRIEVGGVPCIVFAGDAVRVCYAVIERRRGDGEEVVSIEDLIAQKEVPEDAVFISHASPCVTGT